MTESYRPTSDFLCAIIAEEVPLTGSEFANANLRHLIALMRDSETSNRDWATLLLSQQDLDTAEITEALLIAANDEDHVVRCEALAGLARRDKSLALPLVQRELEGDVVSWPLFEAAEMIADPSLVPLLQLWTEPSDNAILDGAVAAALVACQDGQNSPEQNPLA